MSEGKLFEREETFCAWAWGIFLSVGVVKFFVRGRGENCCALAWENFLSVGVGKLFERGRGETFCAWA